MAVYRFIHTCFWEDTKVLDEMDYIDKYFYLYLLTNPHVNQCGCYEISINQIKNESGIEKNDIIRLLEKFENELKLIKICKDTKEILIINFYKYNWTSSPKVKSCIENEISKIKSQNLAEYITKIFQKKYPMDTLSIPKRKEKEKEKEKDILSGKPDSTHLIFSEIIACLNKIGIKEESFQKNKIEFNYENDNKNQKLIKKILDKGYTKDDIMDVIYLKYDQWIENNDKNKMDMSTYYRPSTIFGEKFEEYLQEAKMKGIS